MKKPTRRTAHIGRLVAAALIAALLARRAVPAIFPEPFFAVWLLGFVVVEKVHR